MVDIDNLKDEINKFKASSQEQLEAFRIKFISRKSVVGELFSKMKEVPNEEKKAFGQHINEVKNLAQSKFQELISQLDARKLLRILNQK